MAVRKVVMAGDPRLKAKNELVVNYKSPKIQKLVEDRLAEEFLNKRFDDGDTVTVDAGNGELTFSKTRLADETP